MEGTRAQLREEVSAAVRSGQFHLDAFGMKGEDSEEERTGRRALQIMALTGEFPAGICNIEVQSSEESSDSEDSR